jgi:hypothetical protein
MIGGDIVDFFTKEKKDGHNTVLFLVKDKAYKQTCCVHAAIPDAVMGELQPGLVLWWQADKVYINVFDSLDVPFKKIGWSGSDAAGFYEEKLKFESKKEANTIPNG